jgi:hypothetical protein
MNLIIKRVGKTWTWFEDYIYLTATYKIFTPKGRRVQVGMGLFFAGEPRGEKVAITESGEVITIGAGAIHIRIHDEGTDCEVAITQDSNVLVPILKDNF